MQESNNSDNDRRPPPVPEKPLWRKLRMSIRRPTGQVAPEQPGVFVKNVTYQVKKNKILDDITCFFPQGEVTAILGPSGCGKSTLLDIISQRISINNSDSSGMVSYSGKILTKQRFQQIGGYVYQEDILLSTDTVHECLLEASLLKSNYGNKSFYQVYKERKERVKVLKQEMGLTVCENVRIGDSGQKAASGGQKRRVSISIQLINDPQILLLDEITTGLDSFSSYQIGKILRSLAHDKKKTIISTIHQPSSELFALFDNVLVLHSGKLVFFGPVKALKEYMTAINYPIPDSTNPADWLLNIISNPYLTTSEEEEDGYSSSEDEAVSHYSQHDTNSIVLTENNSPSSYIYNINNNNNNNFESSGIINKALPVIPNISTNNYLKRDSIVPMINQTSKEITMTAAGGDETQVIMNRIEHLADFYRKNYTEKERFLPSMSAPIRKESTYTPGTLSGGYQSQSKLKLACTRFYNYFYTFCAKTLILMFRFLRTTWRDPLIFYSEMAQAIIIGLFTGLLYFRLGLDQQGIQDRLAAFFFLLTAASYIPTTSVISVFPLQRALFTREREANLYGPLLYYLAYSIVHMLIEMIFPLIMLLCAYWLIGFDNMADKFFIQLVIFVLIQLLSESLGLLVGALSRSVDFANIVVGVIITIWYCFSGYLIRNDQIGYWFYPFAVTSIFRYSLHAMSQAEFSGQTFSCPSVSKVLDVYNVTTLCNFKNETYLTLPDTNMDVRLNNYTNDICNSIDWNRTMNAISPSVCLTNGDDILKYYFPNFPLYGNILILILMLILYRIAIYLALRFKRWGRR
ncbi:hypothetical protein ABK040_015499 [Willaertia magna]